MDKSTYWASAEGAELSSALNERRKSFLTFIESQGFLNKWRKSVGHHYGVSGNKSSQYVRSGGQQGELSVLVENEYSSLIQHLVSMICNQRINFQCKASNTDTKSLTQTILANGILNYYLRKSGLDTYLSRATETSLLTDWAWITVEWNTNKGSAIAIDPATGVPVAEGDVQYQCKSPLQVAYDVLIEDSNDIPWIIVDELRSKYELATQFPERAEEILALGIDRAYEAQYSLDSLNETTAVMQSDMIRVCVFHHKRTNALPQGRYALFIPNGPLLAAGGTPYEELPAVRIAPAEIVNRSFGFSPTNHIMALQDVIDGIASALVTNVTNFGVNSIWAQPGHNITVSELANGMALFESQTKPEPINFSTFPPQMQGLLQFFIQRAESISGINSTVRGNPPADASGAAMALLVQQALTFNSGLQSAYMRCVERVGQLTLSHLQQFPNSKRLTAIAGERNAWMMKEWGTEDIQDVTRVFVDVANPLAQTAAGRLSMADSLLQRNLISPNQYIQVIETGDLEPALEDRERQLLTIRDENEALSKGEQVQVLLIENHQDHIKAHMANIATPEAKRDPSLVTATMNHIQEHLAQWKAAPPELLMALGIPSFPSAPMLPPGMPGPNVAPPGPPIPPPGKMISPAQNPIAAAAHEVQSPTFPKIAGSNQHFQPTGPVPPGVRLAHH